jgi:glycosyltransferase involved in cell wall biosynthesis
MLLGKMGLVEDIILWGNQQASNKLVNRLRKWLATRQVKSLFYSKNNAMSLCAFDYDNKKHFHYNNTVKVSHKNVENYSNKMRFINVGGCQKRKRQDIVIRAIAEVAKEYPRIEYIIIGNTENEKPLLDLSKELGVENNIRIIERIDNDLCISGYYDTCLASICFGQAGLTVQQSLGNGVPVIIGRQAINGGEKDAILHGKNGFLVADTNELVIAIKKLIANPTLARTMRRAAKNTYETAYKYEDMVKSFGQVIDASLS